MIACVFISMAFANSAEAKRHTFLGNSVEAQNMKEKNEGEVGLNKVKESDLQQVEELLGTIEAKCRASKIVGQVEETLKILARQITPGVDVKAYGSSKTGICNEESDVDATIMDKSAEGFLKGEDFLTKLAAKVKELKWEIIKMFCKGEFCVLQTNAVPLEILVDITFNNEWAVENTFYLKSYLEKSAPLTKLCRLVRYWATSMNIFNFPYFSHLRWLIMCIFFMQVKHGMPSLKELKRDPKDKNLWNKMNEDKSDKSIDLLFREFLIFCIEELKDGDRVSLEVGALTSTKDSTEAKFVDIVNLRDEIETEERRELIKYNSPKILEQMRKAIAQKTILDMMILRPDVSRIEKPGDDGRRIIDLALINHKHSATRG